MISILAKSFVDHTALKRFVLKPILLKESNVSIKLTGCELGFYSKLNKKFWNPFWIEHSLEIRQ